MTRKSANRCALEDFSIPFVANRLHGRTTLQVIVSVFAFSDVTQSDGKTFDECMSFLVLEPWLAAFRFWSLVAPLLHCKGVGNKRRKRTTLARFSRDHSEPRGRDIKRPFGVMFSTAAPIMTPCFRNLGGTRPEHITLLLTIFSK